MIWSTIKLVYVKVSMAWSSLWLPLDNHHYDTLYEYMEWLRLHNLTICDGRYVRLEMPNGDKLNYWTASARHDEAEIEREINHHMQKWTEGRND